MDFDYAVQEGITSGGIGHPVVNEAVIERDREVVETVSSHYVKYFVDLLIVDNTWHSWNDKK